MPTTTTRAPEGHGDLRARAPKFNYDGLPRYWVANSAVATAMGNALHLIFPMGERFFVRSVRHFTEAIDDPALRAQMKGFYAQEGRHAHEHERIYALIEGQGFDLRGFLRIYKKIAYDGIERISPPKLRLAATAALEHYTAIMAENALEHDLLQRVHPAMREMLVWHACEEIEHKAVAYDVLQTVAPSYPLRVAGMVVATTTLVGFWFLGAAMLLRQEPNLSLRQIFSQFRVAMQANPLGRRVFLRGLREYLRRDFHPWQTDNWALAKAHLARIEKAA